MTEGEDVSRETAGIRLVLPCGHRLIMPWGLSPEVVAAELVHHQSVCELEPGVAGRAAGPLPPSLPYPALEVLP